MKKYALFSLALLITSSIFSQVYTTAESAEYDFVNNQWLVSNGSRMIADDGNGNLTFFGNGPGNAGVEILGNTVFVCVGSGINGYDLTSENEVMSLSIPGTTFLNGLTNDGFGRLFATEFNTRSIFEIDVTDLNNPTFTEIVTETEQTPNGIIYDEANNRLLYTTWTNPGLIKAVDLNTNNVSDVVTTGVGQIDGIDDDADGNYYISSWSPDRITKYNNDFTVAETITTPAINSPADIGYNQETDILAIPIFSDVIFVDLNELSVADFTSEKYAFGVSSNPIKESTFVHFELKSAEEVSLELFDVHGKLIDTLFHKKEAFGIHKVVLTGLNLQSGLYLLEFKTTSGYSEIIKLIVD
ncbi:MAG: T9SS type A sorting domain-containing protein [Bacteroidota bacterium]